MDEFKDTDPVCVMRYCPHCGIEIFCRPDYDTHREKETISEDEFFIKMRQIQSE